MSATRVSSAQSQTHSSRSRDQNKLKIHRFIGVDLSGGKNDRTSVAVLDYYEGQKKLFLTHVYERIQQVEDVSADQALIEIIQEHKEHLEYLCIDVPLNLPTCVRSHGPCAGYENGKEKEILWMWKQYRKHKKKKPRSKLFTPYTQRAVEMYIATELDEGLQPLEALGANLGPLTARAVYLKRRLPAKMKTIEVFPRLSTLRIGQALKIPKSHLNHYKHAIGGDESREVILQNLLKRDLVFIYQQDFHKLIDSSNSFDAFIAAFTGFLKFHGQCEKPPKDFPINDGWIEFPVVNPELY